jgi:hypothetical protein
LIRSPVIPENAPIAIGSTGCPAAQGAAKHFQNEDLIADDAPIEKSQGGDKELCPDQNHTFSTAHHQKSMVLSTWKRLECSRGII